MHRRTVLRAALAACCPLAAPRPAAAQDRLLVELEAGAHLQRVENLFHDPANLQLVSTSTEGKVRFWDARTGQLRRTLLVMPPGRGAIQKSGLSRDGRLLAVGVERLGPGESGQYLFLYDTESSAPPRVLPLPSQVSAVAFSWDGAAMAVAVWDQVHVLSLPDLRPLFQDAFDDVVWALDYAQGGALAAGSFKGLVRVYSPGFATLAQGAPSSGTEITDLKFSPDGTRLAVGFNAGEGNEVLDLPDLNTSGGIAWPAEQQAGLSFARVAWAPDGASVFSTMARAAGPGGAPRYNILAWQAAPDVEPAPRTVFSGQGSILNFTLIPAQTDAIGVGLWDGLVFRTQGRVPQWRSPRVKTVFEAGGASALLLSDDGASAAFAAPRGDEAFRLDLVAGRLAPGDAGAGLNRPLLSAPGLVVETAEGGALRINGHVPALARWETVGAWAVARDGGSVVLATRFKLRRLDAMARAIWTVEPGAETWQVNISADGRHVVAAMGDGTLRWLDAATGAARFSVFVHADLRRWVAWDRRGRFTGPREAWALLTPYQDIPAQDWPPQYDPAAYIQDFHTPGMLAELLGV